MKPAAWNQTDATLLRDYLAQNPNFLNVLKARRPKLGGETLEAAAMQSKKAEGYDKALEMIEELEQPRNDGTANAPFVDTETD